MAVQFPQSESQVVYETSQEGYSKAIAGVSRSAETCKLWVPCLVTLSTCGRGIQAFWSTLAGTAQDQHPCHTCGYGSEMRCPWWLWCGHKDELLSGSSVCVLCRATRLPSLILALLNQSSCSCHANTHLHTHTTQHHPTWWVLPLLLALWFSLSPCLFHCFRSEPFRSEPCLCLLVQPPFFAT